LRLNTQIQGQGFPIICLHGHPGSSQCMSVFTNHLSQRYLTLAPDLRGYGNSRTRQRFEMGDHLQDLETLFQEFNINQCLVLGWSLGGILALELAWKFPEKVKGLILIASAAKPRGNHPSISNLDYVYTGLAGIINWVFPCWRWNIETLGKRSLFRYLIQQHNSSAYHYLAKEAIPAFIQTSGFATQALNQSLRLGYNRLEYLQEIHCPALVLAGECDRHITAASTQETAQLLPNSQFYCYPNTAHLFPWEIPQLVLTDIDSWIAQLLLGDRPYLES
jgi:Predicted hydrolases or acyltransferases (alpha/beta hydrolase superfamily)